MYKIIIFLCLASVALCQVHMEGKCDFKLKQAADITKLVGDWHQLRRINETNSVDGNCLSANFVYNTTSLLAELFTTSVVNRAKVTRNATITIKDPIQFILHIQYTGGVEYDMVVQKTDYENYIILHGCKENSDNTKSVFGQVLTRNAVVQAATNNTIQEALKANTDFTGATWFETSHSADACETDSGVNLQISSFLILLVGLVLAKDM